jgi:hypothetical protein
MSILQHSDLIQTMKSLCHSAYTRMGESLTASIRYWQMRGVTTAGKNSEWNLQAYESIGASTKKQVILLL